MSGAQSTPAKTEILVEQIMTSDVHCVNTDMTVRDAIQLLLSRRIAGAPVVDSNKKVMSVVSEGDLLKLAASVGMAKTIYQCLIKLPKTDKLITLTKTDTFTMVYRKFLSTPVHRLIVVDDKGRLEGIVSRSDVLRVLTDQANPEAKAATTTATTEPVSPAPTKVA